MFKNKKQLIIFFHLIFGIKEISLLCTALSAALTRHVGAYRVICS